MRQVSNAVRAPNLALRFGGISDPSAERGRAQEFPYGVQCPFAAEGGMHSRIIQASAALAG